MKRSIASTSGQPTSDDPYGNGTAAARVTAPCGRCGRTIFVGKNTQSEVIAGADVCAGSMAKTCRESVATFGKFGRKRADPVRSMDAP